MKYSPLTNNIQGKTLEPWDIHFRALAAKERGKDVILLTIGDPDFDTPRVIVDGAINALENGDTHYTEIAGRDTLRDAIASDHQQHSGQITNRENVIVLSGAQNGIFATSLCIAEAGKEIIVLQPMYITL